METNTARRTSGADLRRQEILDAAREEFRAQGFHSASMAAIAGRARMSVGQIYRHFQNKEAVVAAIVESNISDLARDMALLAAAGGDVALSLSEHLCQAVQSCASECCGSLAFEVRAEAARNPKLGELLDRVDDRIGEQIRDLLSTTELAALPNPDIEKRVELVCVLFEGMLMRRLRRPQATQSELIPLLQAMLHPLLSPQPPL